MPLDRSLRVVWYREKPVLEGLRLQYWTEPDAFYWWKIYNVVREVERSDVMKA